MNEWQNHRMHDFEEKKQNIEEKKSLTLKMC